MKVTIYELLGMVKDGKAPKNIKYEDKRYFWTGLNYYNDRYDEYLDNHICIEDLEQYIEIIEEEKKITEKSILDVDSDANESYDIVIINGAEYQISRVERYILGKINEIIDYIMEDK